MPIIGDTQIQPVNFLEQYMRGQEFARGRRVNEQADQLNALKLQAAEREQSNAMALQQALARGAPEDELMRTPGGADYVAAMHKARGERVGADTKDLERRIKGAQFLGQSAGAFLNLPPERLNKATLAPWVSQMTGAGLLSPDVTAIFDQMADDPAQLAQGLQLLQSQAIDAEKQAERQFINQDLGGSVRTLTAPKYGAGPATVLPGSVAATTPSPNRPVTNITNVLPGREKFATTLAEGAATRLGAALDRARGAQRSIDLTQRIRPLLDSPNFISGTLANARLTVAKAVGIDVSETEAYFSAIGQQVAENIKQFGAGTGLSDKDREFAEKMAGGKESLSVEGIRRILRINEEVSRELVKSYNSERGRLAKDVDPSVEQYFPVIGSEAAGKTVVRTGTLNGRKVVEYSDGTITYAD
jgi:hypothetical protein